MNPAPPGRPDPERLSRLFGEAIELPAGDRETFLRESAADDPALADRLRALLAAHEVVERGADRLGILGSALASGEAAALFRSGEPLPGDQVGRYRILRRLGEGGMGVVFLGHDPVLDRPVALKFLPPLLDGDARLLDEARAASALDHPNIGTVYEVGEDAEGRPFLAMASYAGGSLRDRLRGGSRLPVGEAVRIASEVAEALHAAHARGIVHGDVKPENLVFDDAGRVKVVDFGIAHAAPADREEATPTTTTGGTVAYLSPEQVAGGRSDASSDLWSLGVVLFEMLAGARPFEGTERTALRDRIVGGPPASIRESRPEVSPVLADVVAGLLAKDPEDRPASARAVAEALRRAMRPSVGTGSSRGITERLRSVFRGRRGRRVGAGLASVAMVLFLGGVLTARGAPRVIEARGSAGDVFAPRGQVIVSEFASSEALGELALATREALMVDLQQSGFVRVVPRTQVEAVLSRMGHPAETPVRGSVALEVAERAGAGAVLETTVARVGMRFVLGGRAVDPRSGEELFAVRTSAAERGLLGAVERLSREMRSRLGEASESLSASRPLPEVTTASLEALRLFALGEQAMSTDVRQASRLLEAAIVVDPGFAMAHRLAAAAGVNQQQFETTAYHLEQAWQHRERLPDRERWLVEAARASEVEYDPYRANDLYERIVTRFPDESIAWANLGNNRISWLADPVGAFPAFERYLELNPGSVPVLRALGGLALVLKQPERADALFAAAEGPAFDPARLRWRVVRSFWLGDREDIVAACDTLLASDFLPEPQADDREVCGSLDVEAGDFARAYPLLDGVLEDYLRLGRHRNAASVFQALAVADLGSGDTTRARSRFIDAVEHLPASAFGEPDRTITRVNLQIHAAILGWPDLVEAVGAGYPVHPDPHHFLARGGDHLVAAALSLLANDGNGALASLESAFPPGIVPMGWRAYDDFLRARAFELLGEHELAAAHYHRAADLGWAGFAGMTKDRLLLGMARDGLARVEAATRAAALSRG
ncbi:MAG: serine/threonine protein kinase [Gemmatimonadales bacterium]|nr:MAG: serine/threonine protein kinase [Gemmatimonadales bacterium]